MDCCPPGSSVHGIFQARRLEWVPISSSRGFSQSRDRTCLSCIGRWILYKTLGHPGSPWLSAAAAKSLQSCPTLWPHRRQPTRLCCPWDSPGKNTGVGCHFLLQCMKVKSESEVAQSYLTRSNPMDCSLPGSSVHGIFQTRILEWGAIAFSPWLSILYYLYYAMAIYIP